MPSGKDPAGQSNFSKASGPAYAEAVRRITQAAESRAPELDLRIEGLTFLPPLLSALTGLQALDLGLTQISDLAPLSALTGLRTLYLTGTQVSDLTALSALTGLHTLSLSLTPVSDLTALSALTGLQRLYLSQTQVSDVTPLAALTSPQTLHLDRTQVSDLTPFAEMASLIEGGQWNIGGLSFRYCPVAEPLKSFSFLDNPERTIKTINYLREQRGLPPYDASGEFDTAAIIAATRENPLGASAITRGEHIALAPSGNDTDFSVVNEPVARQLHEQLKRRTAPVKELARRINNRIGWTELAATAIAFDALVSKPLSEIAEQIGELWSLSAALGGFSVQDDEARDRPDSAISPLEPDQRRILDDAISISAVFVRRFPTACQLDEDLKDFKAKPAKIGEARHLIEIAVKTDALLPEHGEIVKGVLATPISTEVLNNKAQGRAEATTNNILLRALKIAVVGIAVAGGVVVEKVVGGYLTEIGKEFEQQDVLGKNAVEFLEKSEQHALEFWKDKPPDLKAAQRNVLRQLKQTPRPAPTPRAGK